MSSVEPFGPWVEAMENVGAVDPRNGRVSWNQLASKAGITTSALTRLATGKTTAKPSTVRAVAEALRVRPEVVSSWISAGREVRGPYVPPDEAHLLTDRQRDALTELIRSMVADEQKAGEGHADRPAPMNQAGPSPAGTRTRDHLLDQLDEMEVVDETETRTHHAQGEAYGRA